jgi:hypothetical protein
MERGEEGWEGFGRWVDEEKGACKEGCVGKTYE